jgi:hypothetical protein
MLYPAGFIAMAELLKFKPIIPVGSCWAVFVGSATHVSDRCPESQWDRSPLQNLVQRLKR